MKKTSTTAQRKRITFQNHYGTYKTEINTNRTNKQEDSSSDCKINFSLLRGWPADQALIVYDITERY